MKIKTLSLSEFVMRFLVRTTLLALSLTYAANWFFFRNGDGGEVRVDCGLYSAGQGTAFPTIEAPGPK